MKHFKIGVIVLVALLWAGSAVASVNLVTNGDFEILPSPISPGGYKIYQELEGWKLVTGTGIEVQSGHSSQSGNPTHYVELDSYSNSAMKQRIYNLQSGQTYTLSFEYFNRTNNPQYTSDINVKFGNIDYTTAWYNQAWTTLSMTFLYSGSVMADLIFTAVGSSNSYGGYIDNVSLRTVPVPGAALLLGSALIGIVGMRKKFMA
jgi:hypothetical protein